MKGPIHSQTVCTTEAVAWTCWVYGLVGGVLVCVCVCMYGTKSDRFEIFYTNKRVAEQFV